MELNCWWEALPQESYWLEVTDRSDLGVDLNAPQRRDDGEEYYGYSLIREIKPGDIVFHYHKDSKAIVAASLAAGEIWADNVVWGAHGTVARLAGVQPYIRPGWRLGLDAFQKLNAPLSLTELRSKQGMIQEVRERLQETHTSHLYFPFESLARRDLRPTQAYITKLPAAVVGLFPVLMDAAKRLVACSDGQRHEPHLNESSSSNLDNIGVSYRYADEELAISERDPFCIDPALVERGNRGHATTQNILAAYVTSRGIEPRSPAPDEPNYDIAWSGSGTIYVAEVKSLTDENEEKQLRLGLGQVLRYRHLLRKRYPAVRAILMVEREPRDESWVTLCKELKVYLITPMRVQSLKRLAHSCAHVGMKLTMNYFTMTTRRQSLSA